MSGVSFLIYVGEGFNLKRKVVELKSVVRCQVLTTGSLKMAVFRNVEL
jgi:hypothetical protein